MCYTTTFSECLCQSFHFILLCLEESASVSIRKRLGKLRLACRWMQEKAAESCGIGYKLYQLYELGIKTNPVCSRLKKSPKDLGLGFTNCLPRFRRSSLALANLPVHRRKSPPNGNGNEQNSTTTFQR